ncbi:DegT/DnrJ/EryC1/StrS family aminotransferase [Paenibacillus terrigena]|uniref:DegT/DnrJ/EryC1/StrS family aminotransferase n=1 Tax=Paenibacillus terrigena TaxID=369333 RepID=UPI0028D82806|nr:DegT/DnrJ/EryC1/StrS family aminotransferase [Paenibacillus terrigena]
MKESMTTMEKKTIPLLDLKASYQSIKEELLQAAEKVLEKGHYIMGPEVLEFEREIAEYVGVKYAISIANGTDALLLTLDALGIGPGDEVITTPYTFFATAEVISRLGATPVFVDIDRDTYLIRPESIEQAITPKTKAIIPVHLFGQPADMDEIGLIAKQHGLYVIEDACQALGASYQGKMAGSMGTAGCFSFFPTKNLGGFGDGGMIVTNDEALYAKVKILRVHGSNPKYYHAVLGYNSRLDEIQAALLRVKLRKLQEWTIARIQKAKRYDELLAQLPIRRPVASLDREHVYHLYIIETDHRDALLAHLNASGIDSGIYYPVPLHRQEVYRGLQYGEGSLPCSEDAAQYGLALPLYPELTDEDQQYVVDTIHTFFREMGLSQ